jgi:hypothetical protein
MCPPALPDVYRLEPLLAPDAGRCSQAALRDELYATNPKHWPEANQRGFGHCRLSLALTWLMLRAVNRMVRGLGGESYLGTTSAIPTPHQTMLALDAQYFSTVILSFIVLHEIGHFAREHNKAVGAPVAPIMQQIAEASVRYAEEQGHTAQNLLGSFVGHETAADAFAIDVLEDAYRDGMLEAATLWCAALAGTNNDCGDWLEHYSSDPGRQYPAFAMRVWYLNGRFSTGKRQGRIAHEITRQAEALSQAIGSDDAPVDAGAEVFRKLWRIASAEVGN